MTHLRALVVLLLAASSTPAAIAAGAISNPYFPARLGIVLEYSGTYEFKYLRVEMVPAPRDGYLIRSSGDQSPSVDELVSRGGYTYWILGSSGEQWLKLENSLHAGDTWQHRLRGWNQTYRVVSTDLVVDVPAGKFKNCAEVSISWIAREHDFSGPQQIDLYLAPGVGIVKRIVRSNGAIEHEEVATSIVAPRSDH